MNKVDKKKSKFQRVNNKNWRRWNRKDIVRKISGKIYEKKETTTHTTSLYTLFINISCVSLNKRKNNYFEICQDR